MQNRQYPQASELTMTSMHLFSFQAPQHPMNEIKAIRQPAAMVTLDPVAYGILSVRVI